jgi:F1F0 ATPase subunit 2
MTVNVVSLAVCFSIGLAVGAFYFLGLWWTVRKLAAVRSPVLLTAASFGIRSGIALALLYAVMQGRWENLTASLAGFLLMRLWLVPRLRPGRACQSSGGQ